MADEVLGIQITADAANAIRGLQQATASVNTFNVSLQKLSNTGLTPLAGNFQKQVAAQKTFISSFKDMPTVIKKTGTELARLPGVSNQATFALTNLSRIAQDAPFGFIGITNNINPMLESFQRLKASTGSTGAALKAMASSLMGAGGLGLAVGVVSAALTAFSMGLFDNKKKVEEDTKAVDDFTKEVDEAKEAVERLSRSIQAQNTLGKINLEVDFGKGLKVDLMDFGAQVLAINEQLLDLEGKLDVLNTKKVQLEIDNKFSSSLNKEIQSLYDKETELKDKRQQLYAQQRLARVTDAREQIAEGKKLTDEFAKQQQERFKIFEEYRTKFKSIGEFTSFKFLPIIDFSKMSNSDVKSQLSELFKDMETAFILNGKKAGVLTVDELIKSMAEEMERNRNKFVDALEKGGLKDARVKIQAEIIPPRKQSFEQLLGGLKSIKFDSNGKSILGDISNDAMMAAETINNVLTPAFDNMFEAILAGESPLQAFFDGILESIGEIIKGLIKAAIQAAILSVISNIIAPGAGSSFGAMFGKLTGMGGVARPTGIMGGSRAALSVTVNGRVSGNSLNLVGSRTTRLNGLFG